MKIELVRLQGGKGNSIDEAMLDRLLQTLDALERDGAGAVLTGSERFFSAGLALPPLYALDRATMKRFMQKFNTTMLRLFTFPRPLVAAINGHAIAGGAVLALQCDVRIAAEGEAKIGLNEAAIGLGLPTVVLETLRAQVPASSLVPLALEGQLVSPSRALELGLVNEVVPAARLEERAMERARELASTPAPAFAQLKALVRRPVVERVAQHGAADDEAWLDTWFSPQARERIGAAVARLAGGR